MPSRSAWGQVAQTVKLDELGDEYAGSYIKVKVLSYLGRSQYVDDRTKLANDENATDTDFAKYIVDLLKEHFVSGKLFGEDATVDQLEGAPAPVINLVLDGVLGVIPDPKASQTTTKTSSIQSGTSEQPESESSTKIS